MQEQEQQHSAASAVLHHYSDARVFPTKHFKIKVKTASSLKTRSLQQ